MNSSTSFVKYFTNEIISRGISLCRGTLYITLDTKWTVRYYGNELGLHGIENEEPMRFTGNDWYFNGASLYLQMTLSRLSFLHPFGIPTVPFDRLPPSLAGRAISRHKSTTEGAKEPKTMERKQLGEEDAMPQRSLKAITYRSSRV